MPLDSEQRAEIRRLLEARRESLAQEVKPAKKKSKKKKKTEKPSSRRKLNPIESAAAQELQELEGALKRLEEQEARFGYCERCFMEIPWAELVTHPARRFCSRCS
jgi:RNA polymerase-binding transcription factor DksA